MKEPEYLGCEELKKKKKKEVAALINLICEQKEAKVNNRHNKKVN